MVSGDPYGLMRHLIRLDTGAHVPHDDDLQKLFTFEPDIWNPEDNDDKRPTPILPKDRLLADLLTEYRHLIATYHNHDSLLQHREDEGLTEVERQEAWREYEEEKQYGMSLAEHQRLVMLQQQWIAQQQQQIQQQQQLFHLQYLQQQQQHQLQQHQLQHFILPNFQFPIVSSPNTSGQTIVISDDNSNNSNNNDSQVIITSPPPVLHSGNVVPNKNTKKNKNNNINNTAVTNLTTGSPIITTMTTTASATDVHHSAGSQLIADISTITNNFGNSSNSSASIAVQPSRMQQARYITPAINNLPSNAYGRMYSQVRRGAILKDPSLISDPEKLDKLTMNKLVSVLTTPVLVNTDDVQDLNSFAMRSKTTSHPQSKN
ncbi:unnamed protein product [Trichobilharzia regenti]|nr:unnamed protein product [Trichobilharzia regenti]